jgi:hypothetical protein
VTIFGHDVSDYQAGVDVSRLGARFIIAKTCQAAGGPYSTTRESSYATHKANATRGGKLFGSYIYLGNGVSAAANAALHASVEPDRSVPVMVDWERGSGDVPFLRAVVAELQKLGYTVNLTYAPQWYLNGAGGGGSLAGLPPLCSSKYPDYVPRSVQDSYAARLGSVWNGYGGNSVAVLQFTSAGRDSAYPGTDLDCLAFAGTDAELTALFSTTPTPAATAVTGDQDMPDRELKPSSNGSVTLTVPKNATELIISLGWTSMLVNKVGFFGPTPDKGLDQLQMFGPLQVDGGRPWRIPCADLVAAGALTCEVDYELAPVPGRDVTGTAGFR